MIDKINNRLDISINNLDTNNIEELFIKIIEDLEYILIELKEDEKQLSRVEQFMNGVEISKKKLNYFAKLAKVYFKLTYGMDIDIVNSDDYSLSMGGGGYSPTDDKIYYSYFGAILSRKSELSFLHTCLHEGRHKMQHEIYKSEDLLSFPPYMLRLIKENALEKSLIDNNREFYLENYLNLFIENDAEKFAKEELSTFVRKLFHVYLNKTNKDVSDVDNELMFKLSKIKNSFDLETSKEEFNINEAVTENIYDSQVIRGTYKINGQDIDRLIATDKYIKSHPELQEKYPILRLLFNGNKPKTYNELISDLMKYKEGKTVEEQEKINAIYEEIILSDPILLLSELLLNNDLKSVNEFINTYPSIITEYPDEIRSLNETYGCFDKFIK